MKNPQNLKILRVFILPGKYSKTCVGCAYNYLH